MTTDGQPTPVPVALDGGWGWMVLFGSFMAYFIADGWAYSFGVLYTDLLAQYEDGKAKTATIGALLYGVPLIVSPFVCALTNVYGYRAVAIAGGVLTGSSFVLSSFGNSVDFLCVTTGGLASIGLAMIYISAIVVVTFYFEKYRGIATGVAVTGSGLGAFAFPPLMEFLIEKYTWQGTLLIFGGISFNVIVCGALFRPLAMKYPDAGVADNAIEMQTSGDITTPTVHSRQSLERSSSAENIPRAKQIDTISPNETPLLSEEHQKEEEMCSQSVDIKQTDDEEIVSRCCNKFRTETKLILVSMLDRSLAKNWHYLLWCASTFILYMWVGVPYVYLVDKVQGSGMENGVFLLSIIGMGRAVGQLIFGVLADRPWVSSTALYTFAIGVCGVATALVPYCAGTGTGSDGTSPNPDGTSASYILLAADCAVFGVFVSVTYALQMMCVVDIVGLEKTTSAFGLFQLVQGIATLLGTPVAGWLFDKTGSYDISFYCAGAWILFSALLLIPLPIMLRRKQNAGSESP